MARASQRGRGRLSGIEQLPPEADIIIADAATALQDRTRTQLEIYQDFHAALEQLRRDHHGELDFVTPSFSAFNRYSIKLADMTRHLEETREIAATISARFDAKASDDLTLIAAEAIKSLVFSILSNHRGKIDPKSALNLAGALRQATQAQGVSTNRRMKVEADFKDKVDAAINAAETVMADKPDAKAVLKKIREEVYGIFDKPEAV